MTGVVAALTARVLLGNRRAVAIGLVMLLPVLIAILFRASQEDSLTPPAEFAGDLVGALVLAILLPLVALVMGTAAIGNEIEDGTVVFLLSKPIDRHRVVVVKAAVAAAASAIVCVPTTVATTWIITGGNDGGLTVGLGLAALVASIVYSVVFVALSTATSRALVIGLMYVFVWEAVLANVFSGLAWLSVRAYSEAVADAAIDAFSYRAELGPVAGAVMSLLVVGAALVIGGRQLAEFEIGERT